MSASCALSNCGNDAVNARIRMCTPCVRRSWRLCDSCAFRGFNGHTYRPSHIPKAVVTSATTGGCTCTDDGEKRLFRMGKGTLVLLGNTGEAAVVVAERDSSSLRVSDLDSNVQVANNKADVLAIGMFYASEAFADAADLGEAAFRDRVRCVAMERLGLRVFSASHYAAATTANAEGGRHLQCNVNTVRIVKESLWNRDPWSTASIRTVVCDWWRMPAAYARKVYTPTLFREVLPALQRKGHLASPLVVYVPNLCGGVWEQIRNACCQLYGIAQLRVPNENPLFAATVDANERHELPDGYTHEGELQNRFEPGRPLFWKLTLAAT
jgi:hypothetical protein